MSGGEGASSRSGAGRAASGCDCLGLGSEKGSSQSQLWAPPGVAREAKEERRDQQT